MYHILIFNFLTNAFVYHLCPFSCIKSLVDVLHLFCIDSLKSIISIMLQVSMMERDFYLGRILTGRISSGIIHIGDKIHGIRCTDNGIEKIEEGKVGHPLCFIICFKSRLKLLCILIVHPKSTFSGSRKKGCGLMLGL